MQKIELQQCHIYTAMHVIAEAVARKTQKNPEWIKRIMRDAQKWLDDPANDRPSELRATYEELLIPVYELAKQYQAIDITEYYV